MTSRFAAVVSLLAALAAGPSPAAAATPAAAAAITPPRPLDPLRADYPQGASTEHDVLLEIVVSSGGRVEDARVIEGQAPFSEAAVGASKGWRFDAALRGGKPARARLRVKIHFAPPAPEVPVAEPPKPTAPAPPQERRAPIDVVILGAPRAPDVPGATSLGRAEVRALPGAFGDPFRAIEAMPGVTPMASGFPYFYVRGAPPGNVGYFLDGIRVPALFHLLAGPAIVPSALIERVDLYPGGYPAEYGRFAGGIVTSELREPSSELRAEGTLRLVDAGALVEAPLPRDLGSALAGARYSYTAPAVSLFAPDIRLDFWDYQGRVAINLSPTDRLTIFAFGSHDDSARRTDDRWIPVFASEFHRVDVRYDAALGDGTRLQQALTFGVDNSLATAAEELVAPHVRSTTLGARTRVVHRATDGVLLRAGMNAELSTYEAESQNLVALDASLFPSREDIAVGLFADAVIDAGRGVELTPGARVDLWGSQGASALSADVRFAVRAKVTPRVRLIDAVGLAHQAPGFVIPVPGVAVGGLKGGLQKSVQTSAGVEADLPLDMTGSATFFYNAFFGLSDLMGTAGIDTRLYGKDNESDLAWFNNRALGSAVGMELYLRRKLSKRVGGFVAYTLSRSSRKIGRHSFAAKYDRTHTLSAALSWDIGRGFRVGSRVAFYTGTPTEPFYPESYVALSGLRRLPPFARLDARAEKRWRLGERGWISVVAEVQNATLSKEPSGIVCYSSPRPLCEPESSGPITIPSLGVEGGL